MNSPIDSRKWVLLISLLFFATRFQPIQTQPWYPDEGMFVELAHSMTTPGPAAIGALKQTSFFPLSASILAPALASLFMRIAPTDALMAARIWSLLLDLAGALCLWQAAVALKRPWLGVGAALTWAVWPLAITLGSWAFYHHLAAALMAASVWALARLWEAPGKRVWMVFCGLVGTTVAAAYWTWWMGLLPLVLAWRYRREAWVLTGLLLLALPLAMVMSHGYLVDPVGFWADARELTRQTVSDLPPEIRRIKSLYSLYKVAISFPAMGLATLTLLWGAIRAWRTKDAAFGLALLLLVLGGMEAFRQRQNLEGFAYPLILVLPAAAWGMGLLMETLGKLGWGYRPWLGGILVGLCFATLFTPVHLEYMHKLSAPVAPAREFLDYAAKELQTGDLVIGQSALNWGFGPGVRACGFEQVAASNGDKTDFLRADLPESRFVYQPNLGAAKWMVLSSYSYGYSFAQAGVRRLGLEAEQLGWTKLWSNAEYTIYGNPLWGAARPAYAEKILAYYNLYDQAAMEAMARKDWGSARFALQQGLQYSGGDVEGRKRALKNLPGAGR